MKEDKLKQIKKKALEEHIPIIMDDTLQEIEKRMIKNKPSKLITTKSDKIRFFMLYSALFG